MHPDNHTGKVRIINVADTNVAAFEHRGDPRLIGASVSRFIAWRRQNDLPPQRSATFNILHSDLGEGAPENYRIDICAATDQPVADNGSGEQRREFPMYLQRVKFFPDVPESEAVTDVFLPLRN